MLGKHTTSQKIVGIGIGMSSLNHFNSATVMVMAMTMASPMVKKGNFSTLKQEANTDSNVKSTR